MPTALQNRVLLGLESGRKLQDLLREPGMPALKMVEEWLENPEFSVLFEAATGLGRKARGTTPPPAERVPITPFSTGRPPAVLRGGLAPETVARQTEAEQVIEPGPPDKASVLVWSTPDLPEQYDGPVVKLSNSDEAPAFPIELSGMAIAAVSAPPRRGRAAQHTDEELQELVLAELRKGIGPNKLIKAKTFTGFNTNRRAAWLKNPAFVRRWNEALAEGMDKLPESEPAVEVPAAAPELEVHTSAGPDPIRFTLAKEITPSPALAEVLMDFPFAASAPELVNGPAHYNGRETIEQMLVLFGKEAVISFCRLTAYKYRMRAGKKPGNPIEQDIKKALWYEKELTDQLNSSHES